MTFRWSATDPSASDIGSLYDIGLSTRDGSTLSCKDLNGKPQLVSQIAYMTSTDKQNTMDEATELQEKDKLVQLGTSTSVDREWDQWVQNTQGDWSGGAGLRVYGLQSIIDRYYDGQGLLWPLNDWIPQVPFPLKPVTAMPAGGSPGPEYRGLAGGFLFGFGNGYATAYSITNGGNKDIHVRFYSADTFADINLLAAEAATSSVIALFVAHGSVWVVVQRAASGNVNLYRLNWAAGPVLVVDASTPQLIATYTGIAGFPFPSAILSAALLGNRMYVAVALSYGTPGPIWNNTVVVFDFTAAGAPVSNLLVFPSDLKMSITDMNFQGGQLYVAVTDGYSASILAAPTPFNATSTVAVLPGLASALLTSVGSSLFIVAFSTAPNGVINQIDLFTLSSGLLTEIGPPNMPVSSVLAIASPLTYSGYAIWPVIYQKPGAATKTIAVFAYDVARGRLFRALTLDSAAFNGSSLLGHEAVAPFGATNRTASDGAGHNGTFLAQWGLAVYTEGITGQAELAEEFYFGVQPLTPAPAFSGLLQMGSDLITGLFDFTAGSNKLFRQLVVDFIGGLINAVASPLVRINAWFDQDPAQLAAVPDFTTDTNTPNPPVAPLPAELDLVTNKMAQKVVAEIISTGGGFVNNQWINSPKIKDFKVQAATGWVWDLTFNLAPGVKCNTGGDYCWPRQQDPTTTVTVDQVVAYNFLKQLWRLKGGKCTIYLPNGDSYPALIQAEKFSSPKPFAVSSRSDQQSQWQETVKIKIREDI